MVTQRLRRVMVALSVPLISLGASSSVLAIAIGDMTGSGTTVGQGNGQPEGLLASPYDAENYDTAIGQRPTVMADPVTFEVMGFKLGMSVREADRNAKRLRLRFNGGGGRVPSYQARVAAQVSRQLNRLPTDTSRVLDRTAMLATDGSQYALVFAATEPGAASSSLLYITPTLGNSPSAFLDALIARYGAPQFRSVTAGRFSAKWCSKGDVIGMCSERPALSVHGDTATANFQLQAGAMAARDLDKRIAAQANTIAAGQARKPKF